MSKSLFIAAPLALVAGAAVAADICDGGPRSEWMSESEVHARMTELGYGGDYVLAIEDGCIEAKLIEEGRKVEVYLEPITGAVAKIKND